MISGIPAAISEPNVISRMTSAAITPTVGGRADAEALGLLDHLAAGGDLQARHVHRVDLVEQRVPGVVRQQVGALVVVDRRERGLAVGRDLDAPRGVYGLITPATCGNLLTRASSGAIAARTAGESIVPRETWKTIVSTSPLWAWNSRVSRSDARCDSVPGRLKLVAYCVRPTPRRRWSGPRPPPTPPRPGGGGRCTSARDQAALPASSAARSTTSIATGCSECLKSSRCGSSTVRVCALPGGLTEGKWRLDPWEGPIRSPARGPSLGDRDRRAAPTRAYGLSGA